MPDKFKGSRSATEVAAVLGGELCRRAPRAQVSELPIADGGEGTVDLFLGSGFTPVHCRVRGPLGRSHDARYAARGELAVIESASAAGLGLLGRPPDASSAALASTFGVGQLLDDALGRGFRQIVLGLGGSASTDGGAGAAAALGAGLSGRRGPVSPGGLGLADLERVDIEGLSPRLADASIVAACDVDNPLLGEDGAALMYSPQKGADPELASALERALGRWADAVAQAIGRDLSGEPGAGAAGGLGFAVLSLLGGSLEGGTELVLELSGRDRELAGADLVIVGEGSLDAQSLRGKGPVAVAKRARAVGADRVVAVVGRSSLNERELAAAGLDAVYALTEIEPDLDRCMLRTDELLEEIARRIAADWLREPTAG